MHSCFDIEVEATHDGGLICTRCCCGRLQVATKGYSGGKRAGLAALIAAFNKFQS